MITFQSAYFDAVLNQVRDAMREAPVVHADRWQGMVVADSPMGRMIELHDVDLCVDLQGDEGLDHWRHDVRPNLPWADDHFLERVGGEPLNPGVQWANWPWGRSANRFRAADERFNHSYMERLWPRFARATHDGRLHEVRGSESRRYPANDDLEGHRGIGWRYGDLQDLVELLAREPGTRQAWIPLFFPEDTGYGDGGRKPCTLGYQMILRGERLHMYYPLRSCDFVRHLRDDVYLAVRLLLWTLERLRQHDAAFWDTVKPGLFHLHATSLHCFEHDRRNLL
jgi:hypothetical protein